MRKKKLGVVVSDKMNKSIVVTVNTRFKHKLYGKTMSKTKRFIVHDPYNTALVGNKVVIEEHAPISRKKHWVLKTILT